MPAPDVNFSTRSNAHHPSRLYTICAESPHALRAPNSIKYVVCWCFLMSEKQTKKKEGKDTQLLSHRHTGTTPPCFTHMSTAECRDGSRACSNMARLPFFQAVWQLVSYYNCQNKCFLHSEKLSGWWCGRQTTEKGGGRRGEVEPSVGNLWRESWNSIQTWSKERQRGTIQTLTGTDSWRGGTVCVPAIIRLFYKDF